VARPSINTDSKTVFLGTERMVHLLHAEKFEPVVRIGENVKLIGYADYPTQGPTHSELDGKALMSLLKNTQSYFPQNSQETRDFLINLLAILKDLLR